LPLSGSLTITRSRARQLKIAVSVYSLARGSRPAYHARENSWSRIRVGSNHLVFRKGTTLLFRPCYVWKLGGFLCLTFFVVSLLCNLDKILQGTEGNSSIIPPSLSLAVALELNGYHKWSLTICDGCFDTSKSSKMRS